MNDYTDLLAAILAADNQTLTVQLAVAESSLRRGLKTAIKKYNEVQAIMELPEFGGEISVKKSKTADDVYILSAVATTTTTKVRFTILPNESSEDF